jgi:hypothetical protein
MQQLHTMMEPFLREAENEVVLWDDSRIQPGDRWEEEIRNSLRDAGIAVLLVSPQFLASNFIMDHEFPALLNGWRDGKVKLLWVYLSACMYEETELAGIQAARDPSQPLDALPEHERNQALLDIAKKIKAAALS